MKPSAKYFDLAVGP